MHTARVKVIDDDHFPHNKFHGLAAQDVSGIDLFLCYCMWNFRVAGIRVQTLLTIFIDQLKNAYFLVGMYAQAYLVNVVCNPSDTVSGRLLLPTRLETAYLVCAIIVVPYFVLHAGERARTRMDVAGRSTAFLRQNLFRKYLNLSDSSKNEVKPEHFEHTAMAEAPSLASGYSAALEGLEILGRVGMSMYFVFARSPGARCFAVGIPIFVLAWSWLRTEACRPPCPKQESVALLRSLRQTVLKYETISAYKLRPEVNHTFGERATALRQKSSKKAMHMSNTEFVVECLGPVLSGAYIATAVGRVCAGELELGTFLATVQAIRSICRDLSLGLKTHIYIEVYFVVCF